MKKTIFALLFWPFCAFGQRTCYHHSNLGIQTCDSIVPININYVIVAPKQGHTDYNLGYYLKPTPNTKRLSGSLDRTKGGHEYSALQLHDASIKKGSLGKFFDGYRITPGKVSAWLGYATAGVWWGMREAYHADNHVFETKFGVGPYSFWGSEAWQRQYEGNRYETADGKLNDHKAEWGNTFRDVHHFSGQNHNLLVIGCTFGIGIGKQKWRHKLLDVAIGLAIRSTASWATYNYLRR